jgi:thioredoxin-related protein
MNAPRFHWAVLAAALLLAAGCRKSADVPSAPAQPASAASSAAAKPDTAGIAWREAANDADVDAAFAQARAENKPVFLYWGAQWCPPCNQVKATLFNRVDFIERSRAFVPVYIDGDAPGAQKLGARFKVRGYPTMVLFTPAGGELTRLPGEVDPAQYHQVLTLGMNAQRPVKAVLADARRGGAGLTPADWRLLAFHSWETDEQQMPKESVAPMLRQLAAACPPEPAEIATRLLLKSIAAGDAKSPPIDAAARQRLFEVLADERAARLQADVLMNDPTAIVKAASAAKTAERRRLLDVFDAALRRLVGDATLSRADRINALYGRVELARIDVPKDAVAKLPEALLAEVRDQAARADHEVTDGYEREVVIPNAAGVLERAGLLDESDALLQANLARSRSPYYLMLQLSANARQRGDKAGAIGWSHDAFEKSEGPATRLQWGAGYVATLVDLAPADEARIEAAVGRLFDEAAAQPNAFYERSARSLQRVGAKLQAWNKAKAHAPVLQRLQARLDAVCARLPAGDAQRGTCERLLQPAEATNKSA